MWSCEEMTRDDLQSTAGAQLAATSSQVMPLVTNIAATEDSDTLLSLFGGNNSIGKMAVTAPSNAIDDQLLFAQMLADTDGPSKEEQSGLNQSVFENNRAKNDNIVDQEQDHTQVLHQQNRQKLGGFRAKLLHFGKSQMEKGKTLKLGNNKR